MSIRAGVRVLMWQPVLNPIRLRLKKHLTDYFLGVKVRQSNTINLLIEIKK